MDERIGINVFFRIDDGVWFPNVIEEIGCWDYRSKSIGGRNIYSIYVFKNNRTHIEVGLSSESHVKRNEIIQTIRKIISDAPIAFLEDCIHVLPDGVSVETPEGVLKNKQMTMHLNAQIQSPNSTEHFHKNLTYHGIQKNYSIGYQVTNIYNCLKINT